MADRSSQANQSGGGTPSLQRKSRRRPSWQEQKRRAAWGRFWGQANREALKR